jgi:tripartite-type tricarboxylate transporter receptor subunit TctC
MPAHKNTGGKTTMTRKSGAAALLAMGLAAAVMSSGPARAQGQGVQYPTKKVDFIVAFAAGGFADTLARFVAQRLSEKWSQNVVIDNRGGAGGNTAARAVNSANPDGYTVLVTTTALAINPTMYKRLDFTIDQLAAVAIPAASPETIAAHPSKASGGLKEFLAANKDREVTFASAGVGSGSHLAAEYFFKVFAKSKALHVPFRGGNLAIQAILGNQIDLVASSFGVTSQVVEGKLTGLAVASPERNRAMPGVPTFKESGFDFEAESWVGFFVPAKTDPATVARLNVSINEVVSEPAGREHLTKLGFRLAPRNVAESQSYMKSEVEKWGTMVRTIGVYVD